MSNRNIVIQIKTFYKEKIYQKYIGQMATEVFFDQTLKFSYSTAKLPIQATLDGLSGIKNVLVPISSQAHQQCLKVPQDNSPL
jgi:hypothetical protein